MSKCSSMNSHFPGLDALPDKARNSVEAALKSRDKRRVDEQASRANKAAKVAEERHRELEKSLGRENYRSLRRFMHAESLGMRDLLQPPAGLKTNFKTANAARKKNAAAFLRKLEFDSNRLEKIGKRYHEGIADALALPKEKTVAGYSMAGNLKKWQSLSPLHKVALPWGVLIDVDLSDPHRWFLFRPPFFGFNFGFLPVHNSNFTVDREHILHPPAGLVGVIGTMDDGDAGDSDYASLDAFSEIAFGFEVPIAGVVEVLIDAQSTICTHDLRTEDEWGWSNSTTGQTNFLKFDVLHPNVPEPSYAEMSSFSFKTADDHTVHREYLVRGQHYFAQLFSSGPVPAGEHIVITAGTRSFDISGTNDVEIHSRSHFEWFISSVEVRISP
jgi:hypothetical protein